MISNSLKLKITSVILVIMLVLPMFPSALFADENAQKIVRVGYMHYDGYQNGGEGEAKSGSAYEYYQKIKSYNDWEYEYVYGSFSDLLEMLEKGEIDILSCMTYSDERAERFFYSTEAHGSETYYLYTHRDNEEITPASLKTLNGKSIGVMEDSYQEIYLRQWCKTNGVDCEIVTYKLLEELRDALTNKDIDAMVAVCVHEEENEYYPWDSIYRFTSQSLYFAVSKTRPDILKELNDAQAYILSIDEYYGYETMEKYHDGMSFHNIYLNPRQQKYVESCGILKVGYLEGTNPLSFTEPETGEMQGLCREYLDIISENYGINFECFVYQDEEALIEDLQSKKLDIVFPLGMGYSAAEERGLSLTTSICNLPMTAIYKNIGEEATFNKVAVTRNSPTQEGYAQQYYPNAELYYVNGTKEALEAIKSGKADVYFVRSSGLEYMNQKYNIHEEFRTMGVRNDMEAFMATRADDTTLSIVLDKGISLMPHSQRDSAKFRYTYTLEKASLVDAIKDNLGIVIGMLVIVMLLCASIIFVSRLQANIAHMKILERERDKAEKAEHAKTEFLSQMSHDIRTPMNAIIGFTNFIKEEENISTIKTDYVPKIEIASNHLLMLINDVLEMSRIDTGKLVFTREDVDITALIESVATVMKISAEKKHIDLLLDFSVEQKMVHCDANHFSRVISNLLSNAVKFTPDGGKVSVIVKEQDGAPAGRVKYQIQIIDNGIGMSPEFIERIFEPFERERTSTDSGMQGTGLGMAIVKRIVDAAGDNIYVESKQGEGTTFTLNVTMRLVEHEKTDNTRVNLKQDDHYSKEKLRTYFEGKRILLVEDNEFNSTIAYTILENAGFLVETAENGQIAVQMVTDAPTSNYYDIILMDVQMPIMDGYEATRAIRALKDERAKVKIIAVTANAFESDRENAKAAGMDGHVSKPLDVELLYKTLLQVSDTK